MKKILTVFVGLSTFTFVDYTTPTIASEPTEQIPAKDTIVEILHHKVPTHHLLITDTEDPLMLAMIQVESNGRDSIIGDNGKAIGILQMHKIAVRSVNKILRKNDIDKEYSYDDRYSREKQSKCIGYGAMQNIHIVIMKQLLDLGMEDQEVQKRKQLSIIGIKLKKS